MVEAFFFGEGYFGLEEGGELGGGEQGGFGAVGYDAAFFHHEDAVDLGDDVGDVVGDEDDAGSLLGEGAEEMAELALRVEVEGVGGLVEEEHGGARGVPGAYEGSADHDASLLAGGHFTYGFVGEVGGADLFHDLVGAGLHSGGDGGDEIGPEGGAGEEAGEDGVAAGGVEGGFAGEFGGDYSEAFFEFGEVPAGAAEDADFVCGLAFEWRDGVALAGDGLDEGGFAAAVGAEDGDVLAGGYGEVDVVEDDVFSAGDVDVFEVQEGCHVVYEDRRCGVWLMGLEGKTMSDSKQTMAKANTEAGPSTPLLAKCASNFAQDDTS